MFFFSKNTKSKENKLQPQELMSNYKEYKKDILINEYIKNLGDNKAAYKALYLNTSKLS